MSRSQSRSASSERRVLIFGADGLRPDQIDPSLMPNYARLIAGGTRFDSFYSAYPTHTRVNMSTLTTGTRPGTHGVVGNVMFVSGASDDGLVDTSKDAALIGFEEKTGERVLLAPTLGDRLYDQGARLFVAASSSPGASLLWNLNHPYHVVNASSTYGQADLMALHEKLGPPQAEEGRTRYESTKWAAQALIDLGLPDPSNRVMTLWLTEPDASQHWFGLGSNHALRGLRVVDECLGWVLAGARRLGLEDQLDILLISDHGHSTVHAARSLSEHLADARLETGLSLPYVAVGDGLFAAQGARQAAVEQLGTLVAWLVSRPWCDLVFTTGEADGMPNTLPLRLALGEPRHARAPLVTVSPTWRHETNDYGVAGIVNTLTSYAPLRSTHGSASPYDMRAVCVGYGPGFEAGRTVAWPCGTVDVAPTVCDLVGLPLDGFEGRSLLREVPPLAVKRERVAAGDGKGVELAEVAGHHYFLGSSPVGEN